MIKDKKWFIKQYTEIHENLSNLENEIERHLRDKVQITSDDTVLMDLKKRTEDEIKRLNKLRSDERRIFKY